MVNSTTLAQGEALQALAYAEPPLKPEGLARALVGVTLAILSAATLVILGRAYSRGFLGRKGRIWAWEDTFSVLGYATYATSAIFAIKAAYYGLGTREADLNTYLQIRAAEYTMYANVMYGFTVPFIKASVVFTLTHITRDKRFHWALYAMLFTATIMAIVGILATLLYCHPVRAYWNPLLGSCGNFMTVVRIGYAWTAIGIATDWTCAILPWFIIHKLQMPPRTKLTVMIILGLGAVASAATIVRAPYLQYYLADTDLLYWNGAIVMWSQVESGLGLIAAALPSLRLLFRRFLDSTNHSNGHTNGYGGSGAGVGGYGANSYAHSRSKPEPSLPMDNLAGHGKTTSTAGKWRRLDDDNSSSKHIMQTTTVMVHSDTMSEEDVDRARRGGI